MFRSASLFIDTWFTVAVFTIFAASKVDSIVGIPPKIYSMQRILIHINVPICTQGMQRTWWPEAGTIIVTGPYWGYCIIVLVPVKQLWRIWRNASPESTGTNNIDGLVQERRNSSALALELHLSCTNPSILTQQSKSQQNHACMCILFGMYLYNDI